jgi:hypothetical protein
MAEMVRMSGFAFILARLILPLVEPAPRAELIESAPVDVPMVTGSDIARIMRHQVGLDRAAPESLPANVIHWCPRCVIFAPPRTDSFIPAEPDLFEGLP